MGLKGADSGEKIFWGWTSPAPHSKLRAKRWKNTVGRPEIQNFVGALAVRHAHKGVFITTSDFHKNALDYARNLPQKVILIDGKKLAELMIEHNIGVSTAQTLHIKRLDSGYFDPD